MHFSYALTICLAAPQEKSADFPLRTEPPPKEWNIKEINDGLPYRWEKGTVHVLVWEVIEDDRPYKYTQILVLKKFDQPVEKVGPNKPWVLAQVYHNPENKEWPWRRSMIDPAPVADGMAPKYSDAFLFGHEFYQKPPNDEQIDTMLRQSCFRPSLGSCKALLGDKDRILTTKLMAGGVDREAWKKLFGREVSMKLFPELIKPAEAKKQTK